MRPIVSLSSELVRLALARTWVWPFPRLDAPDARHAGVVVPLRLDHDPSVIAIARAEHLRDHGGEIGFPGGKIESYDADVRAAAYRETSEEIGLGHAELEELGILAPVHVVTGRFLIHPFVSELASGSHPKVLSPEIERLIEIPLLPWLTGERRAHGIELERVDQRFVLPHFVLGDRVLYGASALIFFELLSRVARELELTLLPPLVTEDHPWGDRYPR